MIIGPSMEDDESVNSADEDDPFCSHYILKKIDFHNQRSIPQGENIQRLWVYDLLQGLTEVQINNYLQHLTDRQRTELSVILQSLPCGILPIHGCAGSGKTWITIALMEIARLRGLKCLAASSTNATVNNLASRFSGRTSKADHLAIRLHPDHIEMCEILAYSPGAARRGTGKKAERMKNYTFEHSVAATVLKVAGEIETSNPKLLEMQNRYSFLGEILPTHQTSVVNNADIVFTTCITASSKWLREFRDEAEIAFLDEAACIPVADAINVWSGDIPVVLGGDRNQIGPGCMSANILHENKRVVNPLHLQI
ncbi:hypothetical protein EG329_001912 [Mollisiaceae sp. DMI_Dod_QoI]|nr:hypothetical protein EG329_001912 [Helotiales sp. DMI_Dod_QoI]